MINICSTLKNSPNQIALTFPRKCRLQTIERNKEIRKCYDILAPYFTVERCVEMLKEVPWDYKNGIIILSADSIHRIIFHDSLCGK